MIAEDRCDFGEVRRFTIVDMPSGDLWLLDRLRKKWPTISEGSLRGKINYWSASNEFLFIRNDIAVGLAVAMRDNLDGRPYVRAIFTFARYDAEQSSLGEKAIVALYRHMREWAKSMRAVRVYFGGKSDIGLARRQTLLSAEKETEIFSRTE